MLQSARYLQSTAKLISLFSPWYWRVVDLTSDPDRSTQLLELLALGNREPDIAPNESLCAILGLPATVAA